MPIIKGGVERRRAPIRTMTRRAVVVRARTLLLVLRREAEQFWPDRRTQHPMADLAARDLISRGKVRLAMGRSRSFGNPF
jgi:hypothetical protein